MEIELLYFDGCPSYRRPEKSLREVLVEEGLETALKLVAVNNDEEAQRLRFPGSPTIRVNGQDLSGSAMSELRTRVSHVRHARRAEGFPDG